MYDGISSLRRHSLEALLGKGSFFLRTEGLDSIYFTLGHHSSDFNFLLGTYLYSNNFVVQLRVRVI